MTDSKLSQISPRCQKLGATYASKSVNLNLNTGASDEIRTRDLFFTKEVLYP